MPASQRWQFIATGGPLFHPSDTGRSSGALRDLPFFLDRARLRAVTAGPKNRTRPTRITSVTNRFPTAGVETESAPGPGRLRQR
jgi:hypothetical protein